MCVCARPVRWVQCTPSTVFSELRLTGRENANQKINQDGRADLLFLVDHNCLYLQFPEALLTPS